MEVKYCPLYILDYIFGFIIFFNSKNVMLFMALMANELWIESNEMISLSDADRLCIKSRALLPDE